VKMFWQFYGMKKNFFVVKIPEKIFTIFTAAFFGVRMDRLSGQIRPFLRIDTRKVSISEHSNY
jgi:hypothetical protein